MNKDRELKVRTDHQKGTQEITGKMYQGIIPSPEMMKGYQDVDPALPMRLVKAMEDEAAHRRQAENKIIKHGFQSSIFNTLVGFLALIALGLLAYLFMVKGYAVEGAAIAGSIGAVISIFVIGKAISNKKKGKPEQ
jgi:uncharacterized membrane protein